MHHYIVTTIDGSIYSVVTGGDPADSPHLLGNVANIEVIENGKLRSIIPTVI